MCLTCPTGLPCPDGAHSGGASGITGYLPSGSGWLHNRESALEGNRIAAIELHRHAIGIQRIRGYGDNVPIVDAMHYCHRHGIIDLYQRQLRDRDTSGVGYDDSGIAKDIATARDIGQW